jgi:hypothetical protein
MKLKVDVYQANSEWQEVCNRYEQALNNFKAKAHTYPLHQLPNYIYNECKKALEGGRIMGALYSYERETMEDRITELENEREEFEGVISDVLDLLEGIDNGEYESIQEAIKMLKNFAKGLR